MVLHVDSNLLALTLTTTPTSQHPPIDPDAHLDSNLFARPLTPNPNPITPHPHLDCGQVPVATAAAAFVRFGPAEEEHVLGAEEEHTRPKDTGEQEGAAAAATTGATGAAGVNVPGAPGERPGVVRSGRLALHSETWLVECDPNPNPNPSPNPNPTPNPNP